MTDTPSPFESSASFGPEAEGLSEFEEALDRALADHGYAESELFAIRLAVEEAVANGINHGNRRDPDKRVTLTCTVDSDRVFVAVEDEGEGFDPGSVPDPTDDANIEIPSGRGLMLMGAYMSEIRYVPPGNRVEMIYRRGATG
jgi:serine/threonine-protein kinase RsbW